MVMLGDGGQHCEQVRALIDPCSESTLITLRLARRFGRNLERRNMRIVGVVGEAMGTTLLRAQIRIYPPQSTTPLYVEAYGLQRLGITTNSSCFDRQLMRPFLKLPLADPDFAVSRGVDLVLGANAYSRIILDGVYHQGGLLAQRTIFGWTVAGESKASQPTKAAVTCAATPLSDTETWQDILIGLMRRFWAVEEVPPATRQTPADVKCENTYIAKHSRDASGRYSAPLPMHLGRLELFGESLINARRALSAMHRRMQGSPDFAAAYINFMEEYSNLGHMRPLTTEELKSPTQRVHYLPHHGIWQWKDEGRKLRVVFNASCPTSSGCSLNEALFPGPKLQNELATVITRWRRYPISFCTDIKMMFRQIRVNPNDIHLQRILWSPSAEEPALHYALLTVTYGESCAPYLALRTLKQLCIDEGSTLPEAVRAIDQELYVDDFLCGAYDLEHARQRRDQLIELLHAGGFELKKWVSNSPLLLEDLPVDDRLRPDWMLLSSGGPVSELGVSWDPLADRLRFAPPDFERGHPISKRQVLSEIARLFDPAGWLAPVVVRAKMFMQDLWRDKLDWDEDLPLPLSREWEIFRESLQMITSLSLPRWVHWTPSSRVQLHAFADASRRATAATVYLRSSDERGTVEIHLITAKTKLASIKSQISSTRPPIRMTIPRLELRAALLTARLLRSVAKDLDIPFQDCYAWSDSQVTLHWLRSTGPVGNDFVDNYVSHIHELMPDCVWRYVNTRENPADLATKGTDPETLRQRVHWWRGPTWLADDPSTWPEPTLSPPAALTCLLTRVVHEEFFDRFSSLNRMLKMLVRCRRLLLKHQNPAIPAPLLPVTAEEMQTAFLSCVKLSQSRDYALEIEQLTHHIPVDTSSPLRGLAPFLDDNRVLRVGGRLEHWIAAATLPS